MNRLLERYQELANPAYEGFVEKNVLLALSELYQKDNVFYQKYNTVPFETAKRNKGILAKQRVGGRIQKSLGFSHTWSLKPGYENLDYPINIRLFGRNQSLAWGYSELSLNIFHRANGLPAFISDDLIWKQFNKLHNPFGPAKVNDVAGSKSWFLYDVFISEDKFMKISYFVSQGVSLEMATLYSMLDIPREWHQFNSDIPFEWEVKSLNLENDEIVQCIQKFLRIKNIVEEQTS